MTDNQQSLVFAAGGTPVLGILERFGPHQPAKLVTSVSFAQLRQFIRDPSSADNPRTRALDPELEDLYEIREQTQRLVEGQKRQNLKSYADYIEAGLKGAFMTFPPVTLELIRGQVEVRVADERLGEVTFGVCGITTITPSPDSLLATLDGDTFSAAVFSLIPRLRKENDRDTLQLLNAMPVTLEFYWFERKTTEEERIAWGRQAFYDRNVKGVRPNLSLAIGMDDRDAYTLAMRHLVENVPELRNKIELQHRQLRDASDKLFTASVLRQYVACFVEGSSGLQKKTVVAGTSGVEEQLVSWTRTLIETLGIEKIKNRSQYVCAMPSVFVALGLVGHALYRAEPEKRLHQSIIGRLANIDWTRGDHWAGIAGKVSSNGRLTNAGAKEAASLVYDAITNERSDGYRRITREAPRPNTTAAPSELAQA